jgi:putative ABC transport system permease protein
VYLTILSIGIALLLVVCFNFMNLATAQYMARVGEVGIRKVVGSSRLQLMYQFLGESVLLTIIAFLLSIAINELMYPQFSSLVFSYAGPKITSNPVMLLKIFGVTVLVGVFAGSYPAFFMAHLRPVEIFKDILPTAKKSIGLRQILVVSQFTISILLIIVAVLAIKQFDHINQLNLGYNRERVYIARIGYGNYSPDLKAFKNELNSHPGISAVSSAHSIPVNWNTEFRVIPEGASETESWNWNVYAVDYGFIELLEMEIVKGRSFLKDHTEKDSFIINETAARQLPWEDPIGKRLSIKGKKGVIIGVVKNFHFKHVFFEVIPSVLYLSEDFLNYLYFKLADAPKPEVFNFLNEKWDNFIPDLPVEYLPLDEYFRHRYTFYKNLGILISIIGIIAVMSSCVGLIGLASYATRRRTKEIGIRKAHGANVSNIIRLLLADFLRLIVLANVIAWPVTYYAAKKLAEFSLPYPMEVNIWIFIFVTFFTLLIAATAVIVQTYKAATANPVDSLRYE